MVKVKLINPIADPWTHKELPKGGLDANGEPKKRNKDGDVEYLEFGKGDTIEVNEETAQHLEKSGQGKREEV